ncbi:MAG: hypothetical protein K0Q87_3107 [Neobacillus sp.]|jgi:hypothetical protein|nr:hypothetical protein [Neobacillus sp.]
MNNDLTKMLEALKITILMTISVIVVFFLGRYF